MDLYDIDSFKYNINKKVMPKISSEHLLTESEVITGKSQTEALMYWPSDSEINTPQTDAFTQMIWKETKEIGMCCAKDVATNDLYVVALYRPPGNDQQFLRKCH